MWPSRWSGIEKVISILKTKGLADGDPANKGLSGADLENKGYAGFGPRWAVWMVEFTLSGDLSVH